MKKYEKNKSISKIGIIVAFAFIFIFVIGNTKIFASSYDSFISNAEEQLKEFNGTANNDNVTEVIKAIALLKQNPEATQEFLDGIKGKEFTNLREWIGIDENGNISKNKAVNAVYAIASILDTNEYMCKEGSEVDAESYVGKGYLLKQDTIEKNELVLHKNVVDRNNDLDKQTWGFLNGLSGSVRDELKLYYDRYVNLNGEDSNSIIMRYYENGGYIKYDPNFNVGNIEIATGDGEAATGKTANEAIDKAVDDIVGNSVVTKPDEIVNNNVESSTGINVEDRINEYLFQFGELKPDSYPALTLQNFSERVKELIGKGKMSNISDLSKLIGNDLIDSIIKIGRIFIYAAILFFGVRTIWSGVEGKTQFKELLPYLLLGIVFFYLAQNIVDLAQSILDNYDYVNNVSNLWGSVINLIRILAFGGVVFTGIKFLFANAEGKADIKSSLFPLLIGCILVFASSLVISLVINAAKEVTSANTGKYWNIMSEKEVEKTNSYYYRT